MKKFLWILSLGVFLAGLVYYFSNRQSASGTSVREAVSESGSAGPEPSPALISSISQPWGLDLRDAFIGPWDLETDTSLFVGNFYRFLRPRAR